jgi:hypothetical protein
LLLAAAAAAVAATPASAQIVLNTSLTSYTETFNSLGTTSPGPSSLPTGVTVRNGATATSLGTGVLTVNTTGVLSGQMNTAPQTWTTSTPGASNVASGLAGLTDQGTGTTNRALAVRQGGNSFPGTPTNGDPGVAITFQVGNTTGVRDLSLSISLQTLDIQARDTTFTVRYGVGPNPTTFTNLGTYSTGGFSPSVSTFTAALGANASDQPDDLWIQVAALSGSSSGSNRDLFAVDNFTLSYTPVAPVPEPAAVFAFAAAALGLARVVHGSRRQRVASSSCTAASTAVAATASGPASGW